MNSKNSFINHTTLNKLLQLKIFNIECIKEFTTKSIAFQNCFPKHSYHYTYNDYVKYGLQNARSINRNSANILSNINFFNLDIMCITETWTTSDNDLAIRQITPPTFKHFFQHRKNKRGGGIGILFKDFFDFNCISLTLYDTFEHLTLNLYNNSISLHVTIVYRPPSSSTNQFITDMCDFLGRTLRLNNHLIVGDFNLHIDKPSSITDEFINTMKEYDFIQHVSGPTHIKGHTLDLLFTRKSDELFDMCTTHDHNISDHFFLEGQIKIIKSEKKLKNITYRDWKKFDEIKFLHELHNNELFFQSPIESSVDSCVSIYNENLRSLLDNQIPLITKSIRISSEAPWYSHEIRTQQRKRRSLEQIWRRTKSISDRHRYVNQRNLVKTLVEKSKSDFYSNYVKKNSDNPQSLWSSMNKLLHSKVQPILPKGNNIANKFSQFFKEKIDNIRNSFSPTCLHKEVTINSTAILSTLSFASLDEVEKVVKNIKNKSSPRDPIPTNLLKTLSTHLLPIICSIVNSSFKSGMIPQSEKFSIVTPIIKNSKGCINDLSNYRPVSAITTLSKILEKLAYARLMTYLMQNDLLPSRQSAYRPFHSTETALIRFHDDLVRARDSGKITCVVLLDSSAAFDTVDHAILITRLRERFGICNDALKWIDNYLRNRQYSVRVESTYSSTVMMDCGVPQGSILGPVLYSLYTSPISDIIHKYDISHQIYADDTTIYNSFSINDNAESLALLQSCVYEVIDWYNCNRLKINPTKTELFVSGSPHRLLTFNNLSIEVNGNIIECKQTAKLLGVKFDNFLTFKEHITTVAKISFNFLRNLYKIRNYISESTATLIVNAFICSKLDYCNSLLYGCPKYSIKKLQNIQNASVRFIKKLPKHAHITNERKKLHFLTINYRIIFRICCYTHKCIYGSAPQYMKSLIRSSASANINTTLRTQSSIRLHQPICKKFSSFSTAGPLEWNKLPMNIRNINDFNSFKRKLKTYYFSIS